MKYANKMGSVAMIHIPSSMKIGSGILMLMGGGIHSQDGDCISLL
jgi:hypothetical protein